MTLKVIQKVKLVSEVVLTKSIKATNNKLVTQKHSLHCEPSICQ